MIHTICGYGPSMTRPMLSLLLTGLLLPACAQDRTLLEPVAQARAEIAAGDAKPATQAALGMASTAAFLCGYSLEDWQKMGNQAPELPDELADWFALESPAVVRAYPTRGQYELTWGGGEFFGQEVALTVSVATPMSAFTVYLNESSSAAPADTGPADTGATQVDSETLASAVLSTTSCGGEEPQVAGNLSFPVSGDYSWAVTIQGRADVEGEPDDEGMAYTQDALLPSRGDITWSGIASFGRATLQTADASTISEDTWSSAASGRGWESVVDLDLARD